jgi:Zn-dependent peptidase ImmA (M78 family)
VKQLTLDVDGEKVLVKFVSNKAMGRLDDSVHGRGGDYQRSDLTESVIRVNTGMTRAAMRSTLLHEIGHHLIERTQLEITEDLAEDICDAFAWIPAILRDNPRLAKYLLA